MRLAALALMLLAHAGCADAVEAASSDTGAVFPHVDGYSRTHMDDALTQASTCMSCHWSEDGATAEPFAPPCDTCHRWSPYEWAVPSAGEQ